MIKSSERPMMATLHPVTSKACVLRLFGFDVAITTETPEEAEAFCLMWETRFVEGWDGVRAAYAETMIALTEELQEAGVDPDIVLQAIRNLDKRVV